MTKRRNSKKIVYLLLSLLELCMILPLMVYAADPSDSRVVEGRVLFISSYSYAWETVPEQIAGIQQALPQEVTIEYKFMDTKNVNTEQSKELFYQEMLLFVHSVQPYDVIIVGDDDAFNFAVSHQHELFANTPIVFEGVNNAENAFDAKENGNVTGVIESLSYNNTIALAKKLYPEATQIVAILDDTVTGNAERKEYYGIESNFPGLAFKEIDTSLCTQKELITQISDLKETDILLYIMCSEDKDGNTYTSKESVKLISEAAHIPTFSIVSTGMGSGILGGEFVSQREMGFEAAQMAEKILRGMKIEYIPIKKNSPKAFCFDAYKMKEFGISEKQLPKGVEIIHLEDNFWMRNREAIAIVVWIVFILGILLAVVAIDNIRRRKLNGTLEKMKDNLVEASRYDAMTGLYNRRMFMEDVEARIKLKENFGILLMDLDNFKQVNDTLGHNNGDIVLKELASRLKVLQDENFTSYRLAGDEFTAIIDSQNPDVVEAYAKEIQFSFNNPYILERKKHMLHSSIGIALYPKDGESVSELIASADAAMYQIKNHGKGGIAFYDITGSEK